MSKLLVVATLGLTGGLAAADFSGSIGGYYHKRGRGNCPDSSDPQPIGRVNIRKPDYWRRRSYSGW